VTPPDDRTSGSTDVARAFLDELEVWAGADRSPGPAEFHAALLAWLRVAQASQPSMALVHQLAARALEVTDAGLARADAPSALRTEIARTCAAERDDLAASRRAVAAVAASLVTVRGSWIATLSASGMVSDAIARVHADGRRPSVLLAEGRPKLEGRAMAATLAAAGVPVWLVVDAALPLLLPQAAMLWIGADAVTDRGVLNKIGSYAAALAAREHGVPVYALAGRRKFMPGSTASLRIDEMPPDEVWREPAAGVQPRNVYFEIVPLELLRGVVVEDAVLGSAEAAVAAKDRELPAALAAALP